MEDKRQQSIDIKSFYSNTCYGFEYKKTASVNYLLKWKKKKTEKPKRKTKNEKTQSRKGVCLRNISKLQDVGNL